MLAHWSGLGYYSRARNLHRAAQRDPRASRRRVSRATFDEVAALPGIGRSTAAAIMVFAYGARHAILDGNVKRVLARACGIAGYPGDKATLDALWRAAERLLPRRGHRSVHAGPDGPRRDACACGASRSATACPVQRELRRAARAAHRRASGAASAQGAAAPEHGHAGPRAPRRAPAREASRARDLGRSLVLSRARARKRTRAPSARSATARACAASSALPTSSTASRISADDLAAARAGERRRAARRRSRAPVARRSTKVKDAAIPAPVRRIVEGLYPAEDILMNELYE